ncbi:MAG: hypothetical protein ACRDZ8_06555, partial [Acidimicrobiales bacterium]
MNPSSRAAALLALVGLSVGAFVWLVGEMAAFLAHRRWAAISPAALPSILARLPSRLANPATAWPPSVRGQLPRDPWWFAGPAVVVLALFAVAAVVGRVIVGRVIVGRVAV